MAGVLVQPKCEMCSVQQSIQITVQSGILCDMEAMSRKVLPPPPQKKNEHTYNIQNSGRVLDIRFSAWQKEMMKICILLGKTCFTLRRNTDSQNDILNVPKSPMQLCSSSAWQTCILALGERACNVTGLVLLEGTVSMTNKINYFWHYSSFNKQKRQYGVKLLHGVQCHTHRTHSSITALEQVLGTLAFYISRLRYKRL